MAAEVYKVTIIDETGSELVSYVLPEMHREYMSMMSSEYGNVKSEGLMMSELPEDVRSDLGQQNK